MDITIRSASLEDIRHLCDLLADLFTLESDFEPDVEKQVKGLSMLVTDPSASSIVLVAVMVKEVVGMATVQTLISTAEGGRVGFIEDVIVDRKYRSLGIGSLLLEEIVVWSKRTGLKRLQLLADRDNQQALDFYSSRGLTRTRLICFRKMLQ